jgi:restriction system protein
MHESFRHLSSIEFEYYVCTYFSNCGCIDLRVSSHSWDGGIDIRGEYKLFGHLRIHLAIQAKLWDRVIHSPIVQQVRGSLSPHEVGIIVTSSSYSAGAIREAMRIDRQPILLIDGISLQERMEGFVCKSATFESAIGVGLVGTVTK